MAYDFQFERDQSFGEWLHREIHEAVSFEDAAWALDRARRVEIWAWQRRRGYLPIRDRRQMLRKHLQVCRSGPSRP